MKAEDLSTEGCLNLVAGICTRAKWDYMRSKPGSPAQKDVERFLLSGTFDKLTGMNGQQVLCHLRREYRKKHAKGKKRNAAE